jgi:hypothetical protein
MKLFFIDNQGAWPSNKDGTSKAVLAGDLVMWPDNRRYPTFMPIAIATHPNYDGRIVVQAGGRGILVTFIAGAKNAEEARAAFNKSSMVVPESYRISVDAIVHRMVKHFVDEAGGQVTSEVEPLSLMSWMASSEKGKPVAKVIAAALSNLIGGRVGGNISTLKDLTIELQQADKDADAFTICDGLITTIQQSMAARATQADIAPVKRRG